MTHKASPDFWAAFEKLPPAVQRLARRNFELLKSDPRHPSLHFKKVARFRSARVGISYRALAVEDGADLVWFWIGSHATYDKIIAS